MDPVKWADEFRHATQAEPEAVPMLLRAGIVESQVIRERLAAGNIGVSEDHNMLFCDVDKHWEHLSMSERLEHLNRDLFSCCEKYGVDAEAENIAEVTVAEVLKAAEAARKIVRNRTAQAVADTLEGSLSDVRLPNSFDVTSI